MYFCPSGTLIKSTPANIEKDLKKQCQCSCCDQYDFSRTDLDCSGGFAGDVLADNETFNAIWACKVPYFLVQFQPLNSFCRKNSVY